MTDQMAALAPEPAVWNGYGTPLRWPSGVPDIQHVPNMHKAVTKVYRLLDGFAPYCIKRGRY